MCLLYQGSGPSSCSRELATLQEVIAKSKDLRYANVSTALLVEIALGLLLGIKVAYNDDENRVMINPYLERALCSLSFSNSCASVNFSLILYRNAFDSGPRRSNTRKRKAVQVNNINKAPYVMYNPIYITCFPLFPFMHKTLRVCLAEDRETRVWASQRQRRRTNNQERLRSEGSPFVS